ncbi:MAG: nucleotidyltransferase domain-containing protein [Nanoarchaeota archaeon]|nr:nucleotidyltransferase domain-containing protein [Nanoarchaeota archaeon]
MESFYLRQISRKAGIAVTSTKTYLDELLKEGLIIKINEGIYPSFKANRDNNLFKFYKKLNIVERIEVSGLIDYLSDSCLPNSIILFGSASKGEDIKNSDIDLFVQSKEKKLNLEKYEKLLNRKINLFFEPNFFRLNKELKNNILNGIKLKGYIEVFDGTNKNNS